MEGMNYSLSDVAAACGCNGNNNAQWNNPMWLIWASIFGFGGNYGNRGYVGQGLQDVEVMNQLNSIRQTMADNQNANAINTGVAGNHEMMHNIAAQIAGASTSNLMGQKDAAAQMASCCCEIKTGILNQTNQLQGRIDQLANGVTQGFSATAYEAARHATDIMGNQDRNTQRIIDTMNAHWGQELQSKYDDARLELSQLRQNATLINAMKEVAG